MNKRLRYRFFTISILIAFFLTTIRLIQTTLFPDLRLTGIRSHHIPRGHIYDRLNRLIAGISSTGMLYVRPSKLSPELREHIRYYLRSTGFFSETDLSNLDRVDKKFIYIKKNMTPTITKPVLSLLKSLKKGKYLKDDAIGLTFEESRLYPYACLSPIVGVVGRDNTGLHGIEYTLDKSLTQGHNVVLTVDAELSRVAYEELLKVVTESEADGGSVGIIDIKSREILALVQVCDDAHKPLALSHIYEPGSVMKLFTAAFAIEHGVAELDSPDFDDSTPFRIGGYVFSRPAYGHIPLSMMITKSANISFARLASMFESDDFYLWLTNLGFGRKPNLPLTNLEKGIVHVPKKWTLLSKPMMGIGQEIGVTTLQLLIASTVIGGGGLFIDPSLILSIKDTEKTEYFIDNSRNYIQLLHPKKAKELLYALESVVSRGTGKHAALANIRIAGKTGTGKIADPIEGYSVGKNNTVFLGILPIEDPKLAIVVSIHHPKGPYRSGGRISAPLFADITRRILLSFNYHHSQ